MATKGKMGHRATKGKMDRGYRDWREHLVERGSRGMTDWMAQKDQKDHQAHQAHLDPWG